MLEVMTSADRAGTTAANDRVPTVPCETDEMDEPVTIERLRAIGIDAGLAAVGVTDTAVLEPARSVLPSRRAKGQSATMQFTYRNPERATDPGRLLPGASSLVVGLLDYASLTAAGDPGPCPTGTGRGRIARYARLDVYAALRAGLTAIADHLRADGHRVRVLADDNALVDRNAAWRAGLGWYGKNTNLLVPGSGSWFVIGAVATDAAIRPDAQPIGDRCGPCSACLDDCPTGALVAPGVLDARRCIAWLVQAAEPIPAEHRIAVDDWLYGCDICQEVCPPNRSVGRRAPSSAEADRHGLAGSDRPDGAADAHLELAWVLTADDDDLLERCGRWYIAGRDPDVLRRTALVVLGNRADAADPATGALLVRYLGHRSPSLRAHAVWAARRLGLDELAAATRTDRHPLVRAEWAVEVVARSEGEPSQ